jgi:hypothetical protein
VVVANAAHVPPLTSLLEGRRATSTSSGRPTWPDRCASCAPPPAARSPARAESW